MPTDPPATPPPSTASHPAAHAPANLGSSLVVLQPSAPAHPDDRPTIITGNGPTPAERAGPAGGVPVAPGMKLGHFEIIDAVGAGGMAAVLRARDLELGRTVALKILPPGMALDPENVQRFKQEARAAARLDHENVARAFFCGEDRGLHFIAFEYVDGVNLRALIEARGVVPAADCVRLMAQCAAGLGHAAARGVVHRDVKPSNIVVTTDGRAKIVDMGLARSFGATGSVNGGVTQSGVTLGTFDYISPEQALDPRRADVRSDLYSLGCAFYHALTGRPPVPEGTAAKKLHAHQHEPVVDPRVLNPAVPDELAVVLARMMAKNPERRYQTPAELIADLNVIAGRLSVSLDGTAAEAAGVAPRLGRLDESPRLPLGWVAAIGAVAVAAAVLGGAGGPPPSVAPLASPWDEPTAPAPRPAAPPAEPPKPNRASARASVETSDELVAALRDPAVGQIELAPGARYDLSEESRGFAVERPLAITGVAGVSAPTVRVAAAPADADRFAGRRRGALSFARASEVRIEGVRFEVADPPEADDTSDELVGVALLDVAEADFKACRFEADAALRANVTGLSVAAEGREGELTVAHGYFAVRQTVGARLRGRLKARFEETAFAPHPAAIELAAGETTGAAGGELRVRHCTFLLTRGAAFDAKPGAGWRVESGLSLYAAPPPPPDPDPVAMMMAEGGERRPVVLRCEAERPAEAAQYRGDGTANAYYRADPLGWDMRGFGFDECAAQGLPASDPRKVMLAQPPWESKDPVADLTALQAPWRALRLRLTYRAVQVGGDDRLVGVRYRSAPHGMSVYDTWPPKLGDGAELLPRDKVWEPSAERLEKRHYRTWDELRAALQPGDTVYVKHDGRLDLAPLDLPAHALTLRPFPDSAPELTFSPPAGDAPAAAFRVPDGGALTLDGLSIQVEGRPADAGAARPMPPGRQVAAALVSGGGRVAFQKCAVTLGEPGADRLAAVLADDVHGAARRGGASFDGTLLRGAGRGVWARGAWAPDVGLRDAVVALAGPLLQIDAPSAAPGPPALLDVRRSTLVLGGAVLDARAGAAGGVKVEAGQSVFAPVSAARPAPLVALHAAGPADEASRLVDWKGVGRANWYANRALAAPFAELLPADGGAARAVLMPEWFALTKERMPEGYRDVSFAQPPADARKLAAVTAGDLGVIAVTGADANAADAGADPRAVAKPPGGGR